MKEMDLILGPYADAHIGQLGPDELDAYERLLDENDQDLYLWITGTKTRPERLMPLLGEIARASGVGR
ncbi:succinate dehydrogenase assembly factor 2 [Roseinatronobacter bogoriensis]|nr:antitoxin CptB [Rhodobaca bogoriensis DSM 18756]